MKVKLEAFAFLCSDKDFIRARAFIEMINYPIHSNMKAAYCMNNAVGISFWNDGTYTGRISSYSWDNEILPRAQDGRIKIYNSFDEFKEYMINKYFGENDVN